MGDKDGLFRVFTGSSSEGVDTTGAGDAFAAAFVKGYLGGESTLAELGRFASKIAACCIKKGGGRPPRK